MKNKKVIVIALIILIPVVVYVLVSKFYYNDLSDDTKRIEKQTTVNTNQASDFTLTDLSGNQVSLSGFKEKKVFLNFWATWCPPCISEMPFINEIYKENHDIEIITISSNDDKKAVEKYIQSNNYEFKVLLDLDGAIAKKYKAYSIPLSILIDEDGNIIDTHTGAMNKEKMVKFMKLDYNKTFKNITDDEAKAELENDSSIVLLDVRTKEEYDEKHIPNSILIPVDELNSIVTSELKDKDVKIFVYCRSGNRSITASNILIDLGYTNVYNLGGIIDWKYETE